MLLTFIFSFYRVISIVIIAIVIIVIVRIESLY